VPTGNARPRATDNPPGGIERHRATEGAYVAFSRARDRLQIFADTREIDAQVRLELPLSERLQTTIAPEQRLDWLAGRMSRLQVKTSTLDPVLEQASQRQLRERQRERSAEYDRG
jgi:hypothetical protein